MAIAVDRIINPGTDYEFSVSESIADLIIHGLFTESELSAYMTCGYVDNRVQGIVTPNLSLSQMGDYIDSCMFVPSAVTGFSADYSWNKQFPSDFQYYKRNLLVYSEAGINNGQYLTNQDYTKWYIVLDIDIKKFYLKDNFRVSDTVAGFTYTDSNGESIEVYGSYNNTEYQCLWQDDNTATNLFVIGLSIINGKMYFYMDNPHNQAYPKALNSCAIWYDGGIKGGTGEEFITDVTGSTNLSFMPVLDGLPDYTNGQNNQTPSQEYISGYTNSNGEFFGLNKSGHGAAYYDATSISVRDNQIGARITKGMRLAEIFAWAGFKFKFKNTWYKPIIEGGIVTGYTDDMSQESEWDDMTNVTGNTVPSVPPTPPTPESDDFDDHSMGAGTGISGMANLWLLTKSQLSDLHSACSSAPVGFDPLNSFISVMGIGTNPEYLTHDIQYITPINIRMSDGTTWQTGVEGHIVSSQVSAFSFTGITVQRKYNNFLDFSPYATHEIFVPMCGWITLPDIAVDRSITVTYIPDIESLKCRAVVSVVDNSGHKCVIGEKDGIMGADVPFTNVGHSLFVGDAIVNGADVAGEAITMAIGAGFTKTNAKGVTYRPYEGFTLGGSGTLPGAIGNALVSGNLNRTHFMSGNGTRIGFSDGENIQIKSVYHNVDIPSNYAHTVGLMCNKTEKLSKFTGFTVCDNPHINFSALEGEKEEIKRLLEEGVIL